GGTVNVLDISQNPTVVLIAGLNGAGKTNFSGKLASYLRDKKGKKPLLVACDVYRSAAVDQLQVLGEQVSVPVYVNRESNDPIAIAKEGVAEAKRNGNNIVIIDTAGRLAIDEALMTEITA